jgi:hypothetical protein
MRPTTRAKLSLALRRTGTFMLISSGFFAAHRHRELAEWTMVVLIAEIFYMAGFWVERKGGADAPAQS